jgi:hypothetical protein
MTCMIISHQCPNYLDPFSICRVRFQVKSTINCIIVLYIGVYCNTWVILLKKKKRKKKKKNMCICETIFKKEREVDLQRILNRYAEKVHILNMIIHLQINLLIHPVHFVHRPRRVVVDSGLNVPGGHPLPFWYGNRRRGNLMIHMNFLGHLRFGRRSGFVMVATLLRVAPFSIMTFFPDLAFFGKSALASGRSSRFWATSIRRLRSALVVIPVTRKAVKKR